MKTKREKKIGQKRGRVGLERKQEHEGFGRSEKRS